MKKRFIVVLYLFFMGLMIYSGIKIFIWNQENQKNKSLKEKIDKAVTIDEQEEPSEQYHVDFEKLKQANPDTIGWLKVPGTTIEYPVTKTNNNDYYLDHSFDKSENSCGWIFMDSSNSLDGLDDNMVIYGHNRKDGSMFGTLKNILTKEWQENPQNWKITFIMENEPSEYQVFSVYQIEKEGYYITTNFNTTTEYDSFLQKMKKRSIKDFGVNVSTEDSILTLSTCSGSQYRVVLHAKKMKE